jgi:hypothetical protein
MRSLALPRVRVFEHPVSSAKSRIAMIALFIVVVVLLFA